MLQQPMSIRIGAGVSPPHSCFTLDDTTPFVNQTVTLTDCSQNTFTTRTVNWGEGGGEETNDTHVYSDPNTYTVTQTVTSDAGFSQSHVLVTVSPDIVYLQDGFAEPDDTDMNGKSLDVAPMGVTWVVNGSTTWAVETGRCTIITTDNSAGTCVADAEMTDGVMRCIVNCAGSLGGNEASLVTHAVDDLNYWLIYLRADSNSFQLYQVDAGTPGLITNGSFTTDPNTDYSMEVIVSGGQVTASIWATGGDMSDKVTIGPGTFTTGGTATSWGMAAPLTGDAGPNFANFSVQNF